MPVLGDKMSAQLPTIVRGAYESEGVRLQDLFNRAVKAFLEDPTVINLINELEADVSDIADVLAGVLRATITDALGNSAVSTDPYGTTVLRSYDARLDNVLSAKLERIAASLDAINLKLAAMSGTLP